MLNTYFFNNYTEFLDRNQFNPCKLGFYFFQLFDFLDECFLVDKESLTLIDDDYEITSRDNYTGQKTIVSLRDHIKWTTDIKKKRNDEKLIKIRKMDFESLTELKQWFYKDLDNIVAFHFRLTNIILLLMNDHREGKFYYFCNKVKKDVRFVKCTMIFLEIKKRRRASSKISTQS